MKPKEPLLAVLLALVFPGLGQMYSGRTKRGLVLMGIYSGIGVLVLSIIFYAIKPQTHLTMTLVILFATLAISGFAFGIFLIMDAYRCAKAFNQNKNLERKITFGKRTVLILGIVIVLFVPSFDTFIKAYIKKNIVQTYRLPSGSMSPTLQSGDRVLADKAIYRGSKPQRGDLVVFRYPLEPDRDFVMRLIALGGERIEIKEGNVYVDGQFVTDSKIKNRFYYNRGDYGQSGNPVKVPEGHYFVLGDNSASSHDSRFWGFVPQENIIGKVYKIYWPINRLGAIE